MPESRRGFLLGLAAYGMWGLFPLYWPLLEPAGPVEILAHRIVWSLVVMVLLVTALRQWRSVRAVMAVRRTRLILMTAAVLITFNWGTYIYGVNSHHVVETSLGYFINPLVTVLMGVLILGERLRRLQWVALGIAGSAVVALTVDYGRPPWIALVLAFSFGSYGLAKKKANVGAIDGLTVETLVLGPFALAFLVWLQAAGDANFAGHGTGHALLLMGTGVVTVVPLLCFSGAATRVPLTTLGLLQYVTPTIQFAIGVWVTHEPMPTARWFGFGLVWVALVLLTFDSLRNRRATVAEEPVEAPV